MDTVMSQQAHGTKQVSNQPNDERAVVKRTTRQLPKPEFFTALFTGILATTGVIALVFTYVQVRDFRESKQIERLVDEVHQFDSPDFIAIRRALAAKRLDSKNALKPLNVAEAPAEMFQVLDFFEHIAILEQRKYLSD